mmetsp:Transcript_80221/g.227140  ORF Transcript_80221/g.227140 Transcript_80221/m.227140 type:complete len:217 (-) Transcript_80221:298-948(-)
MITGSGDTTEGERSTAGACCWFGSVSPPMGSSLPGMIGCQAAPEWKALMKQRSRARLVSSYFGILWPSSCQTTSRHSGRQWRMRSSKSQGDVVSSPRLHVWNRGIELTLLGRQSGQTPTFGKRVDMQSRNLNCPCRSSRPSSASLATWQHSSPPAEKPQSPSTGPCFTTSWQTSSMASGKFTHCSSGEGQPTLSNHVVGFPITLWRPGGESCGDCT